MQALPQPEALLVPLVPTMAARMGHLPVQETCCFRAYFGGCPAGQGSTWALWLITWPG